jgi:hypothetical protein
MVVAWVILAAIRWEEGTAWPVLVAYAVAVAFAWRFAWHRFLHGVRSPEPEQWKDYRRLAWTLGIVGVVVTSLLWLL